MGAKVHFLGLLKEFQPGSEDRNEWTVKEGTTIQDIIDVSGIKSSKWEYVITVNGQSVRRQYEVQNDDEVVFSTIFLGG